uniref:CSON013279 protein n=1 Tax=Culicoides sonorensis TaxID=179676 RepID=A0A336M7N7_CULSO
MNDNQKAHLVNENCRPESRPLSVSRRIPYPFRSLSHTQSTYTHIRNTYALMLLSIWRAQSGTYTG